MMVMTVPTMPTRAVGLTFSPKCAIAALATVASHDTIAGFFLIQAAIELSIPEPSLSGAGCYLDRGIRAGAPARVSPDLECVSVRRLKIPHPDTRRKAAIRADLGSLPIGVDRVRGSTSGRLPGQVNTGEAAVRVVKPGHRVNVTRRGEE